ncbi:MAG: hypothetical protein FJ291_02205 [Planctomycetes bacterium]|nr:hypothetical protein [Planctomycetota bacterium]
MKRHTAPLLVLALAFGAEVFFYGQIDDLSSQHWRGMDFPKYRAIAQAVPGLARNVPSPFCYRLLGPYLAGLLPFPDPVAFEILEVIASGSVVVFFYFFMCYLGASPPTAALTVVLFMCNKFFFGFPMWDSFQVNDTLSLAYLEEHFRGSGWVLAVIVLGSVASSFSAWIGRFHLPNESATAALTIGATLLITASALLRTMALRSKARP